MDIDQFTAKLLDNLAKELATHPHAVARATIKSVMFAIQEAAIESGANIERRVKRT